MHLCWVLQSAKKRKRSLESGQEDRQPIYEHAASPTVGASPAAVGGAGAAPGDAAAAAAASSSGVLSRLESEFECVVCRELLVAAHSVIPCGHTFCGDVSFPPFSIALIINCIAILLLLILLLSDAVK